jgi:hypothetical protein
MAQYALVDGELAPVAKLGQRAICWDPTCAWEMIARPGNGQVLPHWAHKPGSKHTYSSDTEKGEWHREVQHLFKSRGADLEVTMRSADGTRDHIADIVMADGRIVEAQTKFLSADNLTSREATYGDMCWVYDAHDFAKWFILGDGADPARFSWGKPDRAFMLHAKPIYFDTGDGIWHLEQMHARHRKGNKGRVVYEGRRRKVAADLLEFVDRVSSGAKFHAAARLTLIDPRKNNRGVKFRTLMDIDQWADENATCTYETFVIDEEAERAAVEAEQRRMAEMVAAYEREQERLRQITDQANARIGEIRRNNRFVEERRQQQLATVVNIADRQPKVRTLPPAAETDWSKLAGMVCICRPGCTDVAWGDAGICHDNCRPCTTMRGTTYTRPSR